MAAGSFRFGFSEYWAVRALDSSRCFVVVLSCSPNRHQLLSLFSSELVLSSFEVPSAITFRSVQEGPVDNFGVFVHFGCKTTVGVK